MERVARLSPSADAVSVSASAWTVDQLQGPFLAYALCALSAALAFALEMVVVLVPSTY